jgi:hypothetical protein
MTDHHESEPTADVRSGPEEREGNERGLAEWVVMYDDAVRIDAEDSDVIYHDMVRCARALTDRTSREGVEKDDEGRPYPCGAFVSGDSRWFCRLESDHVGEHEWVQGAALRSQEAEPRYGYVVVRQTDGRVFLAPHKGYFSTRDQAAESAAQHSSDSVNGARHTVAAVVPVSESTDGEEAS